MAKDPAFLFYSKDWIQGTADMFPEEKGVYIDLLCHQHQTGSLPTDERRLARLVGLGLDEFQKVWQTVKHKFNQEGNQMVNHKLNEVINQRATNKPKKIASATLAGLISSRKLNKNLKEKIKKSFKIDDFIKENESVITDESVIKARVREWFNQMVDQMVNNKGNGIVNGNGNINGNEKGGMEEKSKIIFPFDSEVFRTQWQLWKTFKKKEFEFSFKSEISEQGALKKLSRLSDHDEKTAILIIHQSIENNWKGLFELKQESKDGKQGRNKTVQYSENFKREIFEKLQSE
ncbi:DUF1376 domain-containing protein [Tenacibaculum sp. 190524A02b]|uniref:DUF1376 domain-containing protein n=1 Tax=Tenacibaculum vairaonense TaxID=3137860 RepID=UPI0031FB5AB4